MKKEKELDLVVIGAGAAGLTASIYAVRAKLETMVLEDELVGGQIRNSHSVENFPGFEKISGEELANSFQSHAEKAGVSIDEFGYIKAVKLEDNEKIIETEDVIYKPKAVIIATGAKPKELPIEEEKDLHGKVIHYCELCDGALYNGKDLVVVGGGNSAIEAAIYLTRYAKTIKMVYRRDKFPADKYNQEQLFKHDNISVIWDSQIKHVVYKDQIEKIVLENLKTGEESDIHADGIFVYIGNVPRTELFKDSININEYGYIVANDNMETNIKGVFAAGDVRQKTVRQLTTAVSDGTIAALNAEKYILNLKKQ